MEVPVENSPLGPLHCEAGCQLETKVDVLLTGCMLGNQKWEGQKGVCQFFPVLDDSFKGCFLSVVAVMGCLTYSPHHAGKAKYLINE